MSTEDLQKRTTVNIQEKANLIWAIADKLVGTYKPHEYGNVILPMCVIKRFSETLAPTKQAVLDANALCEQRGLAVRKGFLATASGYDFYNVSPFTFEGLLSDADNIADVIGYTVVMPSDSVDEFTADFVRRFPACKCFHPFTLSFMHELGHLETEWDMVDDTEERNRITDNATYFKLHNERIATDWAGDYLTEHTAEMLIIERQVLTMLHKIWQSIPD
jgi:hypothetical protein